MMSQTTRRRFSRGFSGLALWGLLPGCSLFYQLNSTQCEVTDDCRALGTAFSDTTCVNRVCVPLSAAGGSPALGGNAGRGGVAPGGSGGGGGLEIAGSAGNTAMAGAAGAASECTTNEECINKAATPQPFICRQGACVGLLTDDCPYLLGAQKDNDAYGNLKQPEPIILGAFAGMDPANYHESTQVMNFELAINEFNKSTLGGLPTTGGSRPFVAIVCQANQPDIDSSMNHLLNRLDVPAILSALRAQDLKDAFLKTDPVGHPVFFVSATSANLALANLDSKGMLWYMLGDPAELADPIVALVKRAEPYVTALRQQAYDQDTHSPKLAEDPQRVPLRVTLVEADYTSLIDVAEVLQNTLAFNGKTAAEQLNTSFRVVKIESSITTQNPDVSPALQDLTAHPPHIVILDTLTEYFDSGVFNQVEAHSSWPLTVQPLPFYIAGNGLVNRDSVLNRAGGSFGLAKRMVGVNYAGAADSTLYDEYLVRLTAANPRTTLSLASSENYYDGAYYLLYSFAAAGDRNPFTGKELLNGFEARVIGGDTQVSIGPDAVKTAAPLLFAQGTYAIKLIGTMGPPDFRTNGTRKSPTSAWCVDKPSGATAYQYELDVLRYDEDTGQLIGTFPCFTSF